VDLTSDNFARQVLLGCLVPNFRVRKDRFMIGYITLLFFIYFIIIIFNLIHWLLNRTREIWGSVEVIRLCGSSLPDVYELLISVLNFFIVLYKCLG
jgi:hypothetical protein